MFHQRKLFLPPFIFAFWLAAYRAAADKAGVALDEETASRINEFTSADAGDDAGEQQQQQQQQQQEQQQEQQHERIHFLSRAHMPNHGTQLLGPLPDTLDAARLEQLFPQHLIKFVLETSPRRSGYDFARQRRNQ
jgi:hypothetical protein